MTIHIEKDPSWLPTLEEIALEFNKMVESQERSVEIFKKLVDHIKEEGDEKMIDMVTSFRDEYMNALKISEKIFKKHRVLIATLEQNYGFKLHKN